MLVTDWLSFWFAPNIKQATVFPKVQLGLHFSRSHLLVLQTMLENPAIAAVDRLRSTARFRPNLGEQRSTVL